jgi:nitroreductase
MEALDALLTRVSMPRLEAPAPTAEQCELLFQAALRAPDHGQLRPMRFLTVQGERRAALGEVLAEAVALKSGEASPAALDKARAMPLRAPLIVVVVARLQEHPKVPRHEQLQTAACAAHGILLAAYAQGIGAVWRTGELAYTEHVGKALGLGPYEEVIAFLYLGTPSKAPRTPEPLPTADFVRAW